MLLLISVIAFCQPTNGEMAGILEKAGLSPALAGVIVAVVAVLVGKFIPNKWADIFHYVTIAFVWLDNHTNRLSEEQTKEKKLMDMAIEKAKKLLPVIIMIFLLSGISYQASAQNPFRGFNKKVPSDMFSAGTLNAKGELITKEIRFRPSVGLLASGVRLSQEEGKTYETFPLVKSGVGCSYTVYEPNPDNNLPVIKYTINAMLTVPMTENEQNLGAALGISIFNINGGLGVDFMKNTRFKYMMYAFIGAEYTF